MNYYMYTASLKRFVNRTFKFQVLLEALEALGPKTHDLFRRHKDDILLTI